MKRLRRIKILMRKDQYSKITSIHLETLTVALGKFLKQKVIIKGIVVHLSLHKIYLIRIESVKLDLQYIIMMIKWKLKQTSQRLKKIICPMITH